MRKKTALIAMFVILGSLLIFHALILTQVIPYDQVWGGRLKSVEEMKTFETFSILLNLFMLMILGVKYRHLQSGKRNKLMDILIWLFVVFFALNTLGNLFAESVLELILGTSLTLISAVLCYVIVKRGTLEFTGEKPAQ